MGASNNSLGLELVNPSKSQWLGRAVIVQGVAHSNQPQNNKSCSGPSIQERSVPGNGGQLTERQNVDGSEQVSVSWPEKNTGREAEYSTVVQGYPGGSSATKPLAQAIMCF